MYPRQDIGVTQELGTYCQKLLVFTDLDGSLLDHYSYRYDAAAEALQALSDLQIPVILTSSKTLAEIDELRTGLNIMHPFIVENGAGVILPSGYFQPVPKDLQLYKHWLLKAFGPPRSDILQILHRLRDIYAMKFRGFSDMTIADIVSLTGLSEIDAKNASKRMFTEPIEWRDSDENWMIFSDALNSAGLGAVRGGRFIHIGGGGSKGMALQWLRHCYGEICGTTPVTMALGDSDNDRDMLMAADYPVIVRSPVHEPPILENREDVVVTGMTGPSGWNEAVLHRLKLLGNNT